MTIQEFVNALRQGDVTLDDLILQGKFNKMYCGNEYLDLIVLPPNRLYPSINIGTIDADLVTNDEYAIIQQRIKQIKKHADDFYQKAQRVLRGELTDKNSFRIPEIPADVRATFSEDTLQTLLNDEHPIEFVDCSHTACKAPAVFTLKLEDKIYEPHWDTYYKKPYYKPDLFLVDIIGKNLHNDYLALNLRHEWEINHFPLFFACGKQQFEEKVKQLGIKPGEKIVSLGACSYLRKEDEADYFRLCERHKQEREAAIAADKTGDGYIYQMFRYELANHEYGYTRDLSDTLHFLGLPESEVSQNKALSRGLKKALSHYKK